MSLLIALWGFEFHPNRHLDWTGHPSDYIKSSPAVARVPEKHENQPPLDLPDEGSGTPLGLFGLPPFLVRVRFCSTYNI